MKLPTFNSYGNYSSDNYGAHALVFHLNGADFYFSYQTLVAFRGPQGLRVRKNDWSTTTGKHLNAIDGGNKKARLPSDQFEAEFRATFGEKVPA